MNIAADLYLSTSYLALCLIKTDSKSRKVSKKLNKIVYYSERFLVTFTSASEISISDVVPPFNDSACKEKVSNTQEITTTKTFNEHEKGC